MPFDEKKCISERGYLRDCEESMAKVFLPISRDQGKNRRGRGHTSAADIAGMSRKFVGEKIGLEWGKPRERRQPIPRMWR